MTRIEELEKRFEEKLDASKAANRTRYDELEKYRAANRAEFEKSRAANRADFEKSRAANRARIEELERNVKELRDVRNKYIYLVDFRENARKVQLFFNLLYKNWTKRVYVNGGTLPKGWSGDNQLCLDYRNDEEPKTEDDSLRRERAKKFLHAMWSKFGGSDAGIDTWLQLKTFVGKTHDACHTSNSFNGVKDSGNALKKQREVKPTVDTGSTGRMLDAILPMLHEFGKGIKDSRGKYVWTERFVLEKANEVREKFSKFDERMYMKE
jgi:hypothetical protein